MRKNHIWALLFALFFAVISLDAIAKPKPKPEETDWAKFYRYEEQNTKVSKRPTAVLMGDSITDGWGRKFPEFFERNNFICRGISGQTTSHMLVRFRADVLAHKPKYVVILAGINDIALNNGIITIENIFGNIVSMVELARAHKIKPVLCCLLPAHEARWRKQIGNPTEKILALNKLITDYAKAHRIPLVDYYTAMLSDKGDGSMVSDYARDAVHPNEKGYEIMEKTLLSSVRFR